MSALLKLSTKKLYAANPGTSAAVAYHNYHMIALSEVLSRFVTGDPKNYIQTIRNSWMLPNSSMAVPLPNDRELGFDLNLIPMMNYWPGATEERTPQDNQKKWRPETWAGAHDFAVGAGHWAMSMSTLARIFQGMGPTSGPYVTPLLSPQQFEAISTTSELEETWGLGMKSISPWPTSTANYHVLLHNGGLAGGVCIAGHFVRLDGAGTATTISITIGIATGSVSLDDDDLFALFEPVQLLSNLGIWNNATDLFAPNA